MSHDVHREIERLLASREAAELHAGLDLARREIARVGSEEAQSLFEIISTIFYIDPLDRPDLAPLVNEAVALVVGLGSRVIPPLLRQLHGGDLKAQIAVAHALGRIGADAVVPLIEEYESTSDLDRRQFALYALGKIKSPKVLEAARCVLDAAESEDRELRDTAMRTIGKLAESIPPAELTAEVRTRFVALLQKNATDVNPSIRAKAVRSLGKLARYGHLRPAECDELRRSFAAILGKDEKFEWDRAYLVRREAEEALEYL